VAEFSGAVTLPGAPNGCDARVVKGRGTRLGEQNL